MPFDICSRCEYSMRSHGEYLRKARRERVPRYYYPNCGKTKSKPRHGLIQRIKLSRDQPGASRGPRASDMRIVLVLALAAYGSSLRKVAARSELSVTSVRKIVAEFHRRGNDPKSFRQIFDCMVKNFRLPSDCRVRLWSLWLTLELTACHRRHGQPSTTTCNFLRELRTHGRPLSQACLKRLTLVGR
jgi:hypothetical protein